MFNFFQYKKIINYDVPEAPLWYKLCIWFFWFVSAVCSLLIVLSWLKLVAPNIGWIAFFLCGISTLFVLAISKTSALALRNYKVLTRNLLESQDTKYYQVIGSFVDGQIIRYEDAFFCLYSDEIACAVSKTGCTQHFDIRSVREAIRYANTCCELLDRLSREFRDAASGRQLRISVMSNLGNNAVELYRFVGDEIEGMMTGQISELKAYTISNSDESD